MNVAVFRPNRAIKIGVSNKRSTSGGAEELTGVIVNLARRGHRVTVYSKISPFSDVQLWEELGRLGVRYRPIEDLDKDEQALFIDNAPWINLMGPENVRCSARGFDVLAQWRGPYLYHQSDIDPSMNLPTNFRRFIGPESRKRVLPFIRLGADQLADHLYLNTRPVILLKTQHSEALGRHLQQTYDDYASSARVSFASWNCSVYLLPYLNQRLRDGRPDVKDREQIEYPIAYFGHPRKRDLWFLARPDTHIWGSWNQRMQGWLRRGRGYPIFHNKISPSLIPDLYQVCGIHPSTVDRKGLGYSLFPPRYYEAVWSGCPVIIEDRVYKDPSDAHLGSEYTFSRQSYDQTVGKVLARRNEVVQDQFEKLLSLPSEDEVTSQLETLLDNNRGEVA